MLPLSSGKHAVMPDTGLNLLIEYLEIASPADFKTIPMPAPCPVPTPTPWN